MTMAPAMNMIVITHIQVIMNTNITMTMVFHNEEDYSNLLMGFCVQVRKVTCIGCLRIDRCGRIMYIVFR